MNTETKTKLNPAEVNRRLAEVLGWSSADCPAGSGAVWRNPSDEWVGDPPAYCSDFNAVAEARKALTEEERETFMGRLADAVYGRGFNSAFHRVVPLGFAFELLDAPAEPQARAILAVLEGRKP